ncbi:zinc ribbon domain-containing protein [Candidatus Collinsella stercoripullorum]|uniref:zinc ribbon domain-containing protein n=1 Tax=Candidatus Collinsella stercoripullorum TaxID=2838522 RepID=UPI0022E233C3|nr:zinc ribbon domain-containing protein [Candidatus Collinsella stercoripullorum]
MFCPKCGFKMSDGARFCPKCGAPLADRVPAGNAEEAGPARSEEALRDAGAPGAAPSAPQQAAGAAPTQVPGSGAVAPDAGAAAGAPGPGAGRKRVSKPLIAAVVAVALVLAVAVWGAIAFGLGAAGSAQQDDPPRTVRRSDAGSSDSASDDDAGPAASDAADDEPATPSESVTIGELHVEKQQVVPVIYNAGDVESYETYYVVTADVTNNTDEPRLIAPTLRATVHYTDDYGDEVRTQMDFDSNSYHGYSFWSGEFVAPHESTTMVLFLDHDVSGEDVNGEYLTFDTVDEGVELDGFTLIDTGQQALHEMTNAYRDMELMAPTADNVELGIAWANEWTSEGGYTAQGENLYFGSIVNETDDKMTDVSVTVRATYDGLYVLGTLKSLDGEFVKPGERAALTVGYDRFLDGELAGGSTERALEQDGEPLVGKHLDEGESTDVSKIELHAVDISYHADEFEHTQDEEPTA